MATDTGGIGTLEATWHRPRTFVGWCTDVQHRSLGARYIATGAVFFLLAGVAALLMRLQLAAPERELLNAELYNQLFTVHGTTMMFLFAVPIMQGLGIYLVPMMIGARDMAFPRLNAFGYWVYLLGGSTLWLSLFLGGAPNSGWFNLPPLGTERYQPGGNVDVYALTVSMVEIAAIVAALELVVTVLRLRAPGMGLTRIPLFVWSQLVASVMILVALPTVLVATLLLELDNLIGTHFYSPGGGGDPLLWQHLFWFFGHPEVYIMLLPGLGIVSSVVATFTGREIVGYRYVVAAFVAIGLLSFGVWMHHMFATGSSAAGMGLFSAATFAIVIPSGVQVFATLATLAHGRIRLTVPMLFALGFVVVFVMGGLTGVNLASIAFDLQMHDTYFVVAHFHYVLLGGVVFPVLAGLAYWLPKLTGRMLDERLGKTSFWLIFAGVHLTFLPMHLLGLWGMPRRVVTYLTGLRWDAPNALATIGAFVLALGIGVFLIDVVLSLARGRRAPDDPWGGGTLEWSISSPPPPYGFARTPVVAHSQPLWHPAAEDAAPLPTELVTSLDRRETLATSVLDARPRFRAIQQTSTVVPLLTALAVAVAILGAMVDPVVVAVGLVLVVVALVAWHRPAPREWDRAWLRAGPDGALPTNYTAGVNGMRSLTWSAGVGTVAVSAAVLATLLVAALYLRASHEQWPIDPVVPRPLAPVLLASLPLLAATVPLVVARRAVVRDAGRVAGVALLVAAGLAVLFAALQVRGLAQLSYDHAENVSASVEWVLVGVHLLFVVALVLAALVVGIAALRGLTHAERPDDVAVTVLLGIFVVLAWIPVALVAHLGHALL